MHCLNCKKKLSKWGNALPKTLMQSNPANLTSLSKKGILDLSVALIVKSEIFLRMFLRHRVKEKTKDLADLILKINRSHTTKGSSR